jgi:hypothetical protein
MRKNQSLENLNSRQKTFLGIFTSTIGLLTASLMFARPDRLKVPIWVALLACCCLIITGIAVALHSVVSSRTYNWSIVVLLICSTAIPIWIAFGSGARVCGFKILFLTSDLSCRIGFGASSLVMIVILLIAIFTAIRSPNTR